MADDDSRSEDAEKRPGKSSKPSKKAETGKKDDKAGRKRDDKAKDAKSKDAKSKKADKSDADAKAEKSDDDKAVKTAAKDDKPKPAKKRGLIVFLREIIEQMRKVVYPTRKQLLTYTAVVLIFVTIMIGVIYGLDYAMSKGVTWVFGGGDK